MNRLAVLSLLALSFACSGGETITARVDDADGLAAGDKVIVAGIEVGTVKSVSVADGQAEVVMEITEGQEVALHHGACVHASQGSVEVRPGSEGEMDGEFLAACPRSLADGVVDLQNRMLEAAGSGAREAARQLTKAPDRGRVRAHCAHCGRTLAEARTSIGVDHVGAVPMCHSQRKAVRFCECDFPRRGNFSTRPQNSPPGFTLSQNSPR